MIKFSKLEKLFPHNQYQLGVLSGKDTYHIAQTKLYRYYHTAGTLLFTPQTIRFWKKIKSSLVIVKHTKVACDYGIKEDTQRILDQHFNNIILITLDYKNAAVKAGLGVWGYNGLVWSFKFAFDCKITVWGFLEEIVGYRKPKLPKYLLLCEGCFMCHRACPGQALSRSSIRKFKFFPERCEQIVGPEVKRARRFMGKHDLELSSWRGMRGGISHHCRVCQEQPICRKGIVVDSRR